MKIYSKCYFVFLLIISSAIMTAQDKVAPLRNWSTPLYWQPNKAEKELAAPQIVFSSTQVSPSALTFVAVTPCRLVDTRGSAAGFNGNSPFSGPSITAGQTITFQVQYPNGNTEPAPCGTISPIAQAYSFNITVVPHSGGAVDYVTIWPAGATKPVVSTLDDVQGLVVANAAIVPAGTVATYGAVSVFNYGPATTDVIIDMNGFFAAPTDLNQNTATGIGSLTSNTTGIYNTAYGYNALYWNTTGNNNTADGVGVLVQNETGSQNTAMGFGALGSNISGSFNTAIGNGALLGGIAGYNTAIGNSALSFNGLGNYNTAVGNAALFNNTSGNGNIALGASAGGGAPATNGNSIYIGSPGTGTDANGVIYLGMQGTQTGGTYIAGIWGASATNGTAVYINSAGQLGTSAPTSDARPGQNSELLLNELQKQALKIRALEERLAALEKAK